MEACPRALRSPNHQLDLPPYGYVTKTLLTRFLEEMQIHFLNLGPLQQGPGIVQDFFKAALNFWETGRSALPVSGSMTTP
jgi:hypothetical protein